MDAYAYIALAFFLERIGSSLSCSALRGSRERTAVEQISTALASILDGSGSALPEPSRRLTTILQREIGIERLEHFTRRLARKGEAREAMSEAVVLFTHLRQWANEKAALALERDPIELSAAR
jgi:hypothetical protein